jgi:DNA primase
MLSCRGASELALQSQTQLVKTLLNELDLVCFVKTTGGKGLRVVVPLEPVHTWNEVKSFSKGSCSLQDKTKAQVLAEPGLQNQNSVRIPMAFTAQSQRVRCGRVPIAFSDTT